MDPSVIERCNSSCGELQLQRRGKDYEIISNGVFLMATYNGESERLLVRMPLAILDKPIEILIGGLGVGYSLAEALNDKRVERVVVVEIEEKIIDWNRRYLANFSNKALLDPRTHVIHADLIEWIERTKDMFDVICLDIDNGPDWTVTDKNSVLYQDSGISALCRLLKPKGVIAFWSASQSVSFMEQLSRNFYKVEEIRVDQKKREPDYIYLAYIPSKKGSIKVQTKMYTAVRL